jgi:hypothetical protein
VLILPPGHAEAAAAPRRLTVREKRLIAGVLAVVAAIAVAFIISLSTGGQTSANGCIHLTIPGVVGAQEIDNCGEAARSICQSVARPGAFAPAAAQAIATECRKAGIPATASR